MKVRFYAILVLLVGSLTMKAQGDIHFSQFYASPLTLNPALTGNFDGLWRATGILRIQYPGLAGGGSHGYFTPSVGVDFGLFRNKLKNGVLGLGLVFINDEQNNKTFNVNYILGSAAYNMWFGANHKFQLGVGLQGGVISTTVDFQKLQFNDGFNQDRTYNTSYAGESFAKPKMKGQFNAGIFAKYSITSAIRVYAGYSFNNDTHYKDNYLASVAAYNVPFRHTIHGGFEFDIKDKMVLIPGALYQGEPEAHWNETELGLSVGFHVIKNPDAWKRATLYIGMWDRVNNQNSIIPKIAFEYHQFRAGLAYDLATGQQMKDHSNIGGGLPQSFEVSLSYIGRIKVLKEDHYIFNPVE